MPSHRRKERRMSKPLIAAKQHKSDAAKWHRDVFNLWGRKCYLCRRKSDATDAAHVIGRGSRLGPLRFASPHFGRPAHRDCHERVDRHEIAWPIAIVRDAIRHHNQLSKAKIVLP